MASKNRNNDPIYQIWAQMKSRCTNPKNPKYKDYGGRGIQVCDRWLHSYEDFLTDMGQRPTANHSIDRIENDGNYEPSNCRWADRIAQQNNQRKNHYLTFNGKTLTLSQWARELKIHKNTLRNRIQRGWPVEKALTNSVALKY